VSPKFFLVAAHLTTEFPLRGTPNLVTEMKQTETSPLEESYAVVCLRGGD